MTGPNPPRLAVALLRWFLDDNEPLAGDLLERFAVEQSRLWFWREVLVAVAVRACEHSDHERPLGLAEPSAFAPSERMRSMERSRRINLTASPLPDVGGLGLVALGVLVALTRPDAWWMFLPATVGGMALGLAWALLRRRTGLSGPAGVRWNLLRSPDDAGHAD